MTDYRDPLLNQWGVKFGASPPSTTDLYQLLRVNRPAGTGTDNSPAVGGITHNWSSPGEIADDDTASASISSIGASPVLPYLRASNFGFDIPSSATILGVETSVRYGPSSGSADTIVSEVKLALDATPTLSAGNKATGATWPSSTSVTYGGSSDLWGESTSTITPAVVNSSDFGAVVRANRTSGSTSRTISVSSIVMAVYYSVVEDGAVRLSQAYAEVAFNLPAVPARLTQVYAEVVRSIASAPPPTGRKRRVICVMGG